METFELCDIVRETFIGKVKIYRGFKKETFLYQTFAAAHRSTSTMLFCLSTAWLLTFWLHLADSAHPCGMLESQAIGTPTTQVSKANKRFAASVARVWLYTRFKSQQVLRELASIFERVSKMVGGSGWGERYSIAEIVEELMTQRKTDSSAVVNMASNDALLTGRLTLVWGFRTTRNRCIATGRAVAGSTMPDSIIILVRRSAKWRLRPETGLARTWIWSSLGYKASEGRKLSCQRAGVNFDPKMHLCASSEGQSHPDDAGEGQRQFGPWNSLKRDRGSKNQLSLALLSWVPLSLRLLEHAFWGKGWCS